MPDRKSFTCTLWVLTSLTLLASVLIAPVRTSGFDTVSSRADLLRRDFAVPPGQSPHFAARPLGEKSGQVLALENEEEEKDDEHDLDWILLGVPLRLAPPRSFPRIEPHGLVVSHLTQAYFPLRC